MVMNTNPHNEPKPFGEDVTWQLGYFHECMSGFEHQVASHMMAEGMTDEALVLTRAVHDRHHAAKRNPFNEIECSDHYARAMASYGTFISACGFEYHGPKGYIRFAPKLRGGGAFKAPFTTAEGWGTYSVKKTGGGTEHLLHIKYGSLRLNTVGFPGTARAASVKLGGQTIKAGVERTDDGFRLVFPADIRIRENESLRIIIT
jgi:hypothetical protein